MLFLIFNILYIFVYIIVRNYENSSNVEN